MDPTHEIDPITKHALDEILKELIRQARLVRQKLSELPLDDERRDLLAPMIRRWSLELEQLEESLEQ
jgi:hypothetical protein